MLPRLLYKKTAAAALVALYFLFPRFACAAELPRHQVRLGTAAMPFGWATAIADLDSDEKLDFAIADRTGYGSNGYSYRLQLTLSNAESQNFQFRSTDSALNVSIVDLDNDADLDIVLTHALSGEIAGVWLNDGRGRFDQGHTEDFLQADLKFSGTTAVSATAAPETLAALPLQKKAAIPAARISCGGVILPVFSSLSGSRHLSAEGPLCNLTSPRAPPSVFLS